MTTTTGPAIGLDPAAVRGDFPILEREGHRAGGRRHRAGHAAMHDGPPRGTSRPSTFGSRSAA